MGRCQYCGAELLLGITHRTEREQESCDAARDGRCQVIRQLIVDDGRINVDPQFEFRSEQVAIKAAHPMRTGRHELYTEAMRLVGERHSKGDLVDLVNWLLAGRDAARIEARILREKVEKLEAAARSGE